MLTAATMQRCEEAERQYTAQLALLESPDFYADPARRLSAERALEALEPIVSAYRECRRLASDVAESAGMLRACVEDERPAAQELYAAICGQARACERRLCLLLNRDRLDERGAIVELCRKAQTEAAGEFTSCLQSMLLAYAAQRDWKCTTLHQITGTNPEDLRHVVLEVTGNSVYRAWKHETGVHSGRWMPMFETAARAVGVSAEIVVMPIVSEEEQPLYPGDIREDLYYGNPPGLPGSHCQHIRLWHVPSGVDAIVNGGPGFEGIARPRMKAEMLLRARLHHKPAANPPPPVRDYDWTSGRVKDAQTRHVGAIADVMRGNLEPFVKARIAAEDAAVLSACLEPE